MNDFTFTTPVALLVFNRPEVTARVFAAIREARPERLLVVADGPRADRPTDRDKCAAVREIVEQVDWPCKVDRLYAETNLGCRRRVASGLEWVFCMVEEAIILEDDCLPAPSFFRFCQEMLAEYRDDERVMMVSGSNMLGEWKSAVQSYHFSYYGGIWGWACWRRAWRHYDVDMPLWHDPEIRERVRDVLGLPRHFRLRAKAFDKTAAGTIDTWDYQWSFARLMQSGLTVVPAVNLISNIGFGREATHTKNPRATVANLEVTPCRFPLVVNRFVAVDRAYDIAFMEMMLAQQSLSIKFADVVRSLLDRFWGTESGRV